MKTKTLYFILPLLLASFAFTNPIPNEDAKINDCKNQPLLNKQIVNFVKSQVNKKVGKGECWDLAAQALNSVNAKWDGDLEFGTLVNVKNNECVYAGDIIQFKGVKIVYQEGNTFFSESYEHHTAIVYSVKEKGSYTIAQQNTSKHGRKVGIDNLTLKSITAGSYKIYRPTK